MTTDCVNPVEPPSVGSPYELLLTAALLIPISHYLLGFLIISLVFLYNFMEMHFFQDLFTGFRGQPVKLTFNPSSKLYHDVVSMCKILHGRYLSTPWLCSPHLQTIYQHYFGFAPVVKYKRQIFIASDGGTIALDWVIKDHYHVKRTANEVNDEVYYDGRNPIMIIVPGLTSTSNSSYVKILVHEMAKSGYNVVVNNHRGFGGVPITSDHLYNAGRTEDLRKVIDHIHCKYPEAPLFAIGTSIGANILVKYLGEDKTNVPIIGAAAICCPWDLLIGDRFMNRGRLQRFYNKALAVGLKAYAQLHEPVFSRISKWESVKRSSSIREFDDHATRVVDYYETVDTFYRRCSSSKYVVSVKIPLLCISSLDDPVCTREAIPWDECRFNSNVVLATTQHGGHLPYFEGLTAKSVWWVRAVEEYFSVLKSCHRKEKAPFVCVSEDGHENMNKYDWEDLIRPEESPHEKQNANIEQDITRRKGFLNIIAPVKRSLWVLVYVALVTSWPIVGSVLLFSRERFQNLFT
ncbi:hypothetical protein ACJIZ3_015784 [Penstemon smallii]|uniref:Serine aminopeptidase S33 domain-containing protein n=1 Tax=Penstemon smallii TaxID=265156 RepID=A0ABD3RRV8_9LAMI